MARAEAAARGSAGLLVLLLTAMPADGQEPAPAVKAEADSVGRAEDPLVPRVTRPSGPLEPTAADPVLPAGGRLSPRAVLVRSAVLPGWGQAATGRWWKALLFAGAGAGWLASAAVESARVRAAPTPQEHEDRAARRNTRVLLYLVTATLSAVDAYVDAHLEDFEVGAGDLGAPGVRLSVRWDLCWDL